MAVTDAAPSPDADDSRIVWELRLYVAGRSMTSLAAHQNLEVLCEAHVPGKYRIEIVDLLSAPERAEEHNVLALPTLVRCKPGPPRKVIGDLSLPDPVRRGLELPAKP